MGHSAANNRVRAPIPAGRRPVHPVAAMGVADTTADRRAVGLIPAGRRPVHRVAAMEAADTTADRRVVGLIPAGQRLARLVAEAMVAARPAPAEDRAVGTPEAARLATDIITIK